MRVDTGIIETPCQDPSVIQPGILGLVPLFAWASSTIDTRSVTKHLNIVSCFFKAWHAGVPIVQGHKGSLQVFVCILVDIPTSHKLCMANACLALILEPETVRRLTDTPPYTRSLLRATTSYGHLTTKHNPNVPETTLLNDATLKNRFGWKWKRCPRLHLQDAPPQPGASDAGAPGLNLRCLISVLAFSALTSIGRSCGNFLLIFVAAVLFSFQVLLDLYAIWNCCVPYAVHALYKFQELVFHSPKRRLL